MILLHLILRNKMSVELWFNRVLKLWMIVTLGARFTDCGEMLMKYIIQTKFYHLIYVNYHIPHYSHYFLFLFSKNKIMFNFK